MQTAVEARNGNYTTIASQLRFQRRPWYDLEGSLDNHYTKAQALSPSGAATSPEDDDDDDLEIRVNELLFSPVARQDCPASHCCPAALSAC